MATPTARILVTDDDPLMLNAATRLLTSAGYEVIPAINGEQTLHLAQEHHPDLLLLDVILPDIEGTEICRRIKKDAQTADIVIILLSGVRTGSDEQSDAIEGGADGYITRPIANRELLARIQAHLRIKATEQKLKEYTRQYENLYNFAPVGYFTLERDGMIQKANFAGAKLLGLSNDALTRQPFEFFVSISSRATFNDFLETVFTSRNKETCEVAIQKGETVPAWVHIEAIRDSDETCQAVVSDITERSQMEAQREISVNALRESEERLAFVLEGSQLGYWDWDIATGEVQRNECWAEMLGYTTDEIKLNVKQWTDLQHPDDRPAAWKSIQDHLEGRTPIHKAEYRMLTKNGEYKWILDCARIVKRDAQGRPLRMSGTHTDITERKQAEVALQAEKSNLDAIFESSPVAMFILDDTTNIVKLNAAAVLMTGGNSSEALQRRPGNALRCIHSLKDPRGCGYSKECKVCNVRNGIEALIAKGGAIHGAELMLELIRNGEPQKVWMSIGAEPILLNGRQHVCVAMDEITERKQVEAALRESEQRHRAIIETAMDGFWLLDVQGCLLEVNETYCRMSGYTDQELLSMCIPDLEAVEIAGETSAHIQKIMEQGEDRFESRHRRKDGSVFDVEVSVQYRPEEGGRLVTFLRDITARKRAEDALRNSEIFSQALIANSPIGISVRSRSGDLLSSNAAWRNIWAISTEEYQEMLKEKSDELLFDERDVILLPYQDQVRQVYEYGGFLNLSNLKTRYYRPGNAEWVSQYYYAIMDDQGQVERVVTLTEDITARKQAEEQLAHLNQHLELILGSVAEGILGLDLEGRHTFVNPAAANMLGYEADELIGHHSHSIWHHTKPDGSSYPDDECKIYATCKSGIAQHVNADVFWRKSGTYFAVEYASTPIFEQGKLAGAVVTFTDITERRRAEEALRESEERYKIMFETASIAINITRGIDIIYANPSYLEMFGFSNMDELKDYGPLELFVPESRSKILENIQNRAKGLAVPSSYEAECFRKDSTRFPVLMHLTRTTFADGPATIGFILDITERKQAENRLRHARQFLRSIQNALSTNLAVLDQNGVIVQVNSGWRDFGNENGLESMDYCLGMNYLDVCDAATGTNAEEARLVAQDIRDVLAGRKKEARIEYPCHSPSERRWFSLHITKFEDGEKSWVVLSHENITERKMAEHQALERAKELRAFFNLAEISAKDGISLDELYQEFIDILPQSWQYAENAFARIVMGEREYRTKNFTESTWMQSAPVRVNGAVAGLIEVGYVDEHLNQDDGPFLKEERELINAIAERIGQITERKQADEALQTSEARYRQAITAAGAVPYYRDYQGDKQSYIFMGEGILELTGYDTSEITPATFDQIVQETIMRGSLTHLTEDEAGKLSEAGEIQHWACDYRIRTRDGQTRWCSDAAVQVRDENNRRIGVIGILQDITERKLAEHALEERNQMLMAIYRVALEIGVELRLPVLLKNILEHVQAMLDADRGGGIYLYDAAENVIRLAQGAGVNQGREGSIIQINQGVAGRVFQTSQPVIVDDYTHWEGRTTVIIPDPPSTVMGVPLFQKGQVVGVLLLVADSHRRKFTDQDVKRVEMFAAQAAIAIQNARLFEMAQNEIFERKRAEDEMQQRVIELEMLYESGLALPQLLNPKAIGEKIIELLENKMDWHHTIIRLYHPQDETLEIIALSFPDTKSEEEQRAAKEHMTHTISKSGEGLSGWVVQNKQTVRNGNVTSDPRYKESYPGINSGLYVPIKLNENVIGVISIESEQPNAFNEADERLAATLANQAAVAIENANLTTGLEQRVTERTAEVRDLYDNAPTGYHSLDANGIIVMINQTELDWLGYTREDLIGIKMFRDLFTPQSQQIFDENFPRFKARGWVKDLEFDVIRKDGSTFPVLLNATAIYDANGNYQHSRSTLFDITERKHAETALRESEEQNRLLFEESPVPVALLNAEGVIVRANRAYQELTGLTLEQLLKYTAHDLQLPAPESDRLRDILLHPESPGVNSVYVEFTMRGANGNQIEVASRIFPFILNGSEHILVTTLDVSTYKKAEELLRQANAEMEHAMRMKDDFLANMSHELRTPLTGILGMTESMLLQVGGPLTERQKKYLGNIDTSGRHLLALINDILDLSKIEAGKVELELENLFVGDICQASLAFIKEPAMKKRVNIDYHCEPASIFMVADARRLKQILVNLLGNAVKFTNPDGRVSLNVQANLQQACIRFDVIDTGIGMSAQDITRLFTPFTQVDSSLTRRHEGTGLGLALVKKLTELHGGKIFVKSEPGKGSCFTVTIPWRQGVTEIATPTGPISIYQIIPNSPETTIRKRILLAEDNEINSDITRDFLEISGYEVAQALDGSMALSLAPQFHPNLVLMDIQMPVLDGLEAIRQIRKIPEFKKTPIIALTALAMPGDRERCLAAGADEYITKPFSLSALVLMIEMLLKDRK